MITTVSTSILTVIAVATAVSIFISLIRQTMRADRAEADLAKIEATIDGCGRALVADDLHRSIARKLLLAKARASVSEVAK